VWGRNNEPFVITSFILFYGLQTVTHAGSSIARKSALRLHSVPITESPESLPSSSRHSRVASTTHILAGILRRSRRYRAFIFFSL
jgi:hypothetical protein